ncbi:hypothetical protein [Cognatiyoonia sp. IB215446]|uniref:hypothetical protein n=1 Tax=Cognatiyoonia sp. IB215446 TaxID=3097355 RepID=UPI002A241431|nr:hypothetical protein [Cognatiyoonia sp. IB215446]
MKFTKLNIGWNAEPNAPLLSVNEGDRCLVARFKPNPFLHPEFEDVLRMEVRFESCSRYRITGLNDEGWYLGQCRFSKLAPAWGEFYEIAGDTNDDAEQTPWIAMEGSGSRHFHFYLRDETLEVKAQDWSMRIVS